MSEGIINKYLKIIEEKKHDDNLMVNSEDLGKLILNMAKELSGVKVTAKNIEMFRKFAKDYGDKELFMAVINMSNVEDVNGENCFPLLKHILRETAEEKLNKAIEKRNERNLNIYADKVQKKIDKIKKDEDGK